MDAEETFADFNMSAPYAAFDRMENQNALKIKQINPSRSPILSLQNHPMIPLNEYSQDIPNQKTLPTRNIFANKSSRSRNNNMIWINQKQNIQNHVQNEQMLNKYQNNNYTAPAYQWRASRDLTELGPPENHSLITSLSSQPPPDHQLTIQESELMNLIDLNIFKPISVIDIHKFQHYTRFHPNQALIAYIIKGLKQGFRLGYTNHRKLSIMNNLSSLELSPSTLPAFIQKEIKLGRIAGPFSLKNPPINIFMVNPLGLVEKRDTNPLEYRVITHHSASHGDSVNDSIDKHELEFHLIH